MKSLRRKLLLVLCVVSTTFPMFAVPSEAGPARWVDVPGSSSSFYFTSWAENVASYELGSNHLNGQDIDAYVMLTSNDPKDRLGGYTTRMQGPKHVVDDSLPRVVSVRATLRDVELCYETTASPSQTFDGAATITLFVQEWSNGTFVQQLPQGVSIHYEPVSNSNNSEVCTTVSFEHTSGPLVFTAQPNRAYQAVITWGAHAKHHHGNVVEVRALSDLVNVTWDVLP